MHSNAEDLRTFENLESSCRNARIPPRPLHHQRPFKNASLPVVSPFRPEPPFGAEPQGRSQVRGLPNRLRREFSEL